jgi:hypothetical protein
LRFFEFRDHRGLDGDLKDEGDRRRTRSGRSAAEDGGGETFLAIARNGQRPGEESLTAAIAVQAIEAQLAFGQIEPMRGQVLAGAERHLGEVPAMHRHAQEARRSWRRNGRPGVQKGGHLGREQRDASAPAGGHRLHCPERSNRHHRSAREDRDIAVILDDRLSALVPTEKRQSH